MSYAYLDKYQILHIVDTEAMAQEFASGKIVTTDIANAGGYPINENNAHIIVYVAEGKYKVGGVEAPISQLAMDYPAVDALVREILA